MNLKSYSSAVLESDNKKKKNKINTYIFFYQFFSWINVILTVYNTIWITNRKPHFSVVITGTIL